MSIAERIERLNHHIHQLEAECHRAHGSVSLLAVSKGQDTGAMEKAFETGLINFGENYLQEALDKQRILTSLPIIWHFIGPIQSNKVKLIAEHFSWVHSVCRIKIAQMLNDHRPNSLPPLNVCIQVNIEREESKSGLFTEDVAMFAALIKSLPRLKLRGLMLIPKQDTEANERYATFLQLKQLLLDLNHQLSLSMDTLSMGMTDDIEPAIRAGSTFIRIGRGIFGERQT